MHRTSTSVSHRLSLLILYSALVVMTACDDDGPSGPGSNGTLVVTPERAAHLDLEGGFFVDVPEGAVDRRLTLSAETMASPTAPAGTVFVSRLLRMGPEGQTFVTAVEIGLPINSSLLPAGATEDDVVVLRAPTGTEDFLAIPSRLSADGSTVVGVTEHFSDFVAAVVMPSNESIAERFQGAWTYCGDGLSYPATVEAIQAFCDAASSSDSYLFQADGSMVYHDGSSCEAFGEWSIDTSSNLLWEECKGTVSSEAVDTAGVHFEGVDDRFVVIGFVGSGEVEYEVFERMDEPPIACVGTTYVPGVGTCGPVGTP